MAAWNSGDRASSPGLAPEQRDDGATAGVELVPESVGDRRGLRIGIGPAAGAERSRHLRGEWQRQDRDDDGEDGDGATEAIDERSPAVEHR